MAKSIRDRGLEGALTGRLSLVSQSLGRWDAAQAWAKKQLQVSLSKVGQPECSLVLCFKVGLALSERRMEAAACGNLGRVFAHSGDPTNARRLYHRQLQLAGGVADRRGVLAVLSPSQPRPAIPLTKKRPLEAQRNMAWAEEALGRWREARSALESMLGLATGISDEVGQAEAHGKLAKLLHKLKAPPADIRRHLDEFDRLTAAIRTLLLVSSCRTSGDGCIAEEAGKGRSAGAGGGSSGCGTEVEGLWEVWVEVGEAEKGLGELEGALMVAQEEGDVGAERRLCHLLGRAHARLARHKEAIRYLQQELSLAKELRDHVSMGGAYEALGAAQLAAGLDADALESFKYHLAIAHITSDTPAKLKALTAIGDLLRQARNLPAALKVPSSPSILLLFQKAGL